MMSDRKVHGIRITIHSTQGEIDPALMEQHYYTPFPRRRFGAELRLECFKAETSTCDLRIWFVRVIRGQIHVHPTGIVCKQ